MKECSVKMAEWQIVILIISVFFLIILGLLFFQPRFILRYLEKRNPEVVFFVETQEPIIALTIDDGPDATTTPQMLELLAQYDAKATFFLIGKHVSGNEDIVKRMVQDGHEIGNHNQEDVSSISLSPSEFEKQLRETHYLLSQFAVIKWYRPGSGWYNSRMIKQVKKLDYKIALLSIHPYDPQIPSITFSRFQILANLSPGSIIILHDVGERGTRTLAVLKYILPELRRKGYKAVTLSELIKQTNK